MKQKKVKKKEVVISYDTKSIPISLTMEDVIMLFHNSGFLVYQSQFNGIRIGPNKPEILSHENPEDVRLVDMSTEEGMKIYNKIKTKK